MNTERTEKFVNAIACDLEEGGFLQVSGTTLRRTLATAVSAALPLLADVGIPASQPAELAEQQGVSLPPFPRTYYDAFGDGSEPLYTGKQMQDYARAAIAATGAQQVGEVQGDALADAVGRIFGCDGSPYRTRDLAAVLLEFAARQPGAHARHDWALLPRDPVAALPCLHALADAAGLERLPDPNEEDSYPITGQQSTVCQWYAAMLAAAPPAQGIDLGQQQDAARWRWVREQNGVTVSVEEADDDGDMTFVSGHTPEELDAAIDGQRDAAPGVGNG